MRIVVVGAGVHGRAAAWHLARLGAHDVTLLEQFTLGHERGSSHGESRITRTSYHDAGYARLAAEAMSEDWPRLERDAARRFVHPTPGLFVGPRGGRIEEYAAAARDACSPVDPMDVADARRRFPQFRFAGDVSVLVDRSAGVIAAAEAMQALLERAVAAGVTVTERTPVLRLETRATHVGVVTPGATLEADRVVVTAGAWVTRLVPSLAPRLAVARQTVCWFAAPDASDAYRPPRFPVWVWLGAAEHDHFYGLPEFGRPGLKAARHATGEGGGDPDAAPDAPPQGAIDEVREMLARELTTPPGPLLGWQHCLYTNEPRQDFVVGPLPDDPRVIVGAACSGHAFKFGPLVGRVLAELALRGTTSSPAFEAMRARLARA